MAFIRIRSSVAGAVAIVAIGALIRAQTPATVPSTLTLVDAGSSLVAAPPTSPRELSGLTYAGGTDYYAVSDSKSALYPLSIAINGADGSIASVTVKEAIVLKSESGRPAIGDDLEGVAFDAAADEVLVVNESGLSDPRNTIVRFRRSDWRKVGFVDLTDTVFTSRGVRDGFGLESLALNGTSVWTANEEALEGDGPRATSRRGTTVRLTRFEAGRLAGQWAYVTEPAGGALPYVNTNADGVPDLLALPDGRVLVLERATYASQVAGDFGGFISRIFEVDWAGATDVAARPGLATLVEGTNYLPVRKRLLWQRAFPLLTGPNNFEGLSLGPLLDDGSRSVLLVSDNDVLPSNFWALRLKGL